jgi:hypothetical protein
MAPGWTTRLQDKCPTPKYYYSIGFVGSCKGRSEGVFFLSLLFLADERKELNMTPSLNFCCCIVEEETSKRCKPVLVGY